jgi:hypothetical protein
VYLVVYPKWANGPRIDGQNHPKFLILLARPIRTPDPQIRSLVLTVVQAGTDLRTLSEEL